MLSSWWRSLDSSRALKDLIVSFVIVVIVSYGKMRQMLEPSMSHRIDGVPPSVLVLRQAIERREMNLGLGSHSAWGGRHAAADYLNLVVDDTDDLQYVPHSDCWDNALMESFSATSAAEWVPRMRFKTREDAKRKICELVELFYYRQRSHSGLDNHQPMALVTTVLMT